MFEINSVVMCRFGVDGSAKPVRVLNQRGNELMGYSYLVHDEELHVFGTAVPTNETVLVCTNFRSVNIEAEEGSCNSPLFKMDPYSAAWSLGFKYYV